MKKILIIIILLISLTAIFLLTNMESKGSYDEFAKCLSNNGVVFYGSSSCGHCQNQKEMFGESFKYVNYVECSQNQELCRQMGITAYPTWVINGNRYLGEQPLDKLSKLSGCPLNV